MKTTTSTVPDPSRSLLLLALLLPAAPAVAEDATAPALVFDAAGIERVVVRVGSRDVEIAGAPPGRLHVRTGGSQVEARQEGGALVLKGQGGPRLRVEVPPGLSVEVRCHSGDVWVASDGPHPRVAVQTGSGDIDVKGTAGELELKTLSGDVKLAARVTRAVVETVSGSVDGVLAADDARLRTTSGEVELHETIPRRVEATTVSGSLEFEGTLATDARLELESVSGEITLLPTGAPPYRVRLETQSGDVSLPEGSGTVDRSGALDAPVRGGGGAEVRVRTVSGEITLR